MTSERKKTLADKIIIGLLAANLVVTGAAAYQKNTEMENLRTQTETEAEAIGTLSNQLEETQQQLDELESKNDDTQKNLEAVRREVSRGNSRTMNVEITAYDLSEASCNKGASHPAYGLTATGKNLAGHTLESARAIAVDPRVIPLGSKVRIKFKDEDMKQYNGTYTACDTGGAINGNRIDLFAGDGAHALAMKIGRREAVAVVL